MLLPKVRPLLHENGKLIVLLQIEDEYGLLSACDFQYTEHQPNTAMKHLGGSVVYYTTDPPQDDTLKSGSIEGCLLNADFGTAWKPEEAVKGLRLH
ncbi:beta-galactosidase-like [Tropilaelaps mercedesae]|uniref:Beta-galactosidase-like n=1 Tax=Tropilaelaps mercedesae TaxID=418985 RepID=A0A1V9XE63_9ACAR|nr:beta-galactosidase-like [Tropilaelaps mercedesae]